MRQCNRLIQRINNGDIHRGEMPVMKLRKEWIECPPKLTVSVWSESQGFREMPMSETGNRLGGSEVRVSMVQFFIAVQAEQTQCHTSGAFTDVFTGVFTHL